jgi:hypothetical protein
MSQVNQRSLCLVDLVCAITSVAGRVMAARCDVENGVYLTGVGQRCPVVEYVFVDLIDITNTKRCGNHSQIHARYARMQICYSVCEKLAPMALFNMASEMHSKKSDEFNG